jgi:hypothetical protein
MLTEPQRVHIRNATRTMQVIAGALASGVLFFMAIVLFLAAQKVGQPADTALLTYLSAAIALAAFLGLAILPGTMAGKMRQSIVDGDPTIPPTELLPAGSR